MPWLMTSSRCLATRRIRCCDLTRSCSTICRRRTLKPDLRSVGNRFGPQTSTTSGHARRRHDSIPVWLDRIGAAFVVRRNAERRNTDVRRRSGHAGHRRRLTRPDCKSLRRTADARRRPSLQAAIQQASRLGRTKRRSPSGRRYVGRRISFELENTTSFGTRHRRRRFYRFAYRSRFTRRRASSSRPR